MNMKLWQEIFLRTFYANLYIHTAVCREMCRNLWESFS
jgi:hypothetical protein